MPFDRFQALTHATDSLGQTRSDHRGGPIAATVERCSYPLRTVPNMNSGSNIDAVADRWRGATGAW